MRRLVPIVLLAGLLIVIAVLTAGPTVPTAAPAHPVPSVAARAARAGTGPMLAVVGASFSAGVGAAGPDTAWPAVLGRLLGWRVAVNADPGAGYLNPGNDHRGPFTRLTAGLDLPRLRPAMVIVQGGHDDIGRPPALVGRQVRLLIELIRHEAPGARVGVLSVFCGAAGPTPAATAMDRAIVSAARQTDPSVLVFDPLAEHWRFPRIGDGLHPSPAGHRWIAERMAADLAHDGIGRAA